MNLLWEQQFKPKTTYIIICYQQFKYDDTCFLFFGNWNSSISHSQKVLLHLKFFLLFCLYFTVYCTVTLLHSNTKKDIWDLNDCKVVLQGFLCMVLQFECNIVLKDIRIIIIIFNFKTDLYNQVEQKQHAWDYSFPTEIYMILNIQNLNILLH